VSHHIIEVDDLSFVYPDGTAALKGVSLQILHGESVALIGENGAGKSTLLMQFNGTLLPTSGEVRIGHVAVAEKTLPEIRRSVGMVFQNSDDQLFMPTLYEDVAFGLLNKGMKPEELDRTVRRALAERGLNGLEEKFPGHLSGGQKRLASLAGVLVMEPGILLLDEPSTNLDPKSRRNLIQQLGPLAMQGGHQVHAVVHGDLGAMIQRRPQVGVVGVIVLALDGEHGDVVIPHQHRGDVVLGGEGVGSGQHHIRAARLQGLHQIGGLGGDVQAGGDAHASQGLFFDEAFFDELEDGHFFGGPVHAQPALVGQIDVFDVVVFGGHVGLLR